MKHFLISENLYFGAPTEWYIVCGINYTAPVINLCQLEALLLVIRQPNPIPSVVVSSVKAHRCSAKRNAFYFLTKSPGFFGPPEACEGLFQLLYKNILVPKQCVGVGKVGAHLSIRNHADSLCRYLITHLDGPLEEFDGIFMLLLVRKAVSTSTP